MPGAVELLYRLVRQRRYRGLGHAPAHPAHTPRAVPRSNLAPLGRRGFLNNGANKMMDLLTRPPFLAAVLGSSPMHFRRMMWDFIAADRLLSIATSARKRRHWAIILAAFAVVLIWMLSAHSQTHRGRVGATAPKAVVRKAPIPMVPSEAQTDTSKDVDLSKPFESLPAVRPKR